MPDKKMQNNTLYIHIGYPKAGSTHLQRILESQDAVDSLSRGFLYCKDIKLINALAEGRASIEGGKAWNFVHSSEKFIGPSLDYFASDITANYDTKTKIAHAQNSFREYFREISPRIHYINVLIIHRPAKKFLPSQYQECVRSGKYHYDFKKFFSDWWGMFEYTLNIENVIKLIIAEQPNANINIVDFELIRNNYNEWRSIIVNFFGGFFGDYSSAIFAEPISHPSYSPGATEYIRSCNNVMLNVTERAILSYPDGSRAREDLEYFLKMWPRIFNLVSESAENFNLLDRILSRGGSELGRSWPEESAIQILSDFDDKVRAKYFESCPS
jgi:hypothetical protein